MKNIFTACNPGPGKEKKEKKGKIEGRPNLPLQTGVTCKGGSHAANPQK